MRTIIEFRNGEQFCGVLELNNSALLNNGKATLTIAEDIAQSVMKHFEDSKVYADIYHQEIGTDVLDFVYRTQKDLDISK